MNKGNLITRQLTLADNVTVGKFPDDIDTTTAESAKTRARGVTIHSRNSFNLRIAFQSGDIGNADYLTLEAGLYLTISPDEQISDIYFLSENAGGDVVELMLSDTMLGTGITAGPSA